MASRVELALENMLGESHELERPQSRIEDWLHRILGETVETEQPQSRIEKLLAVWAGETVEVEQPQSRTEDWLHCIIGHEVPTETPQSRIEVLLAQIAEQGGGLPDDYREVAGLAFDSAYFVTPVHLRGSDTLRFTYRATAASGVLGSWSDEDGGESNFSYYHSSSFYIRYGGQLARATAAHGTLYNMVISPTGWTSNSRSGEFTPSTFETTEPMYIGRVGMGSSSLYKGTLYGRIIVDGRAEFVPCEHDGSLGYFELRSRSWLLPAEGTVTEVSA